MTSNEKNKTVYLLTFQFSNNYGTMLQAYALQKTLLKMGYECILLNFKPKELTNKYRLVSNPFLSLKTNGVKKNIIKFLISIRDFRHNLIRNISFVKFRKKYLNISNKISNVATLEKYSNSYSSIIVGSDQVWNLKLIVKNEEVYFLDFKNKWTNKISYAASIAEPLSSEELFRISKYLNNFSSISIREKSFIPILKSISDRDIFTSVDPTMLICREEYDAISNNKIIKNKYLLVYDMHKSDFLTEIVNRVSEIYNLDIISYSKKNDYKKHIKSFYSEGPSHFLTYFKQADFIITTSYHGTIFALLYAKPFYTLSHPKKGSRMIDLLTDLNLSDRLIFEDNSPFIISNEIDYKTVNNKILKLRENSMQYLKESIK